MFKEIDLPQNLITKNNIRITLMLTKSKPFASKKKKIESLHSQQSQGYLHHKISQVIFTALFRREGHAIRLKIRLGSQTRTVRYKNQADGERVAEISCEKHACVLKLHISLFQSSFSTKVFFLAKIKVE